MHLAADALEDMAGRRVRHGLGHHQARDAVLRELAGEWVAQAGKPVADRAVQALHFLSADECLTARERAVVRQREKADRAQVIEDGRRRAQAEANEYRAYLAAHAPHLLPSPRRSILGRVLSALGLSRTDGALA